MTTAATYLGYIAQVIVAILGGRWIITRFRPEGVHAVLALLLGLVLLVLVTTIPVLGGLIGWLVAFMGVGALWLVLREWWTSRRAASGTAPLPSSAPAGTVPAPEAH